jgi:SAM-dependent methyltransferase
MNRQPLPDAGLSLNSVMERLRCLRCSTILELDETLLSCPNCNASWPVEHGVPRFFKPEYYWGELPQAKAALFLREAREYGWREACKRRFQGDPDMLISLLDSQRASWLPLLALPADSTALDVGCGYGAITHSLAGAAGQVYSVEAIPERLEFCRIRLQQEGISNVQLVQASALDLPFADDSFDVIVVNGVLEWVGEWERNGNPRSIQSRFLKSLHRLLKANGKLVVGIENRFGYGLFRGGKDHSGVPYTSLMPRWLASLYMGIDKTPHHRMLLNPKREYRTYTYSQRGYRNLLAESGFSSSTFYWADPGYNQPYALIPLTGSFVRRHFRRKQYGLQTTRRGWRSLARKLVTQAMSLLAPDFLIFAQKNGPAEFGISDALPKLSLRNPRYCLYTYPFGYKTVVWVFDSREDSPCLILKAGNGTQAGQARIESEHDVLSLVSVRLEARKDAYFGVPTPGPRCHIGNNIFVTETVADGRQLSEVFYSRSHRQPGRLEKELERCSEVAAKLAYMLQGEACIQEPDASDWQVPLEFKDQGDLQRLINEAHFRRRQGPKWVQHGDFTIENIFLDSASHKITIVDWEHTIRGVTPLYDVFSLLVSALPLADLCEKGSESMPGSLQRNFEQAFFGEGPWTELFRRLLSSACERVALSPDEVWRHLLEFLVLRINHFTRESAEMEREHRQFLVVALQQQQRFLLLRNNVSARAVTN